MSKMKQYQYYLIIGVISLFALFFLPFLGTEIGLAFNIPSTFAGWVVYVVSKVIVAVINVMVFHCFILQGKQNISDNSKYLEACEILALDGFNQETLPKSPKEWKRSVYGKKMLSVAILSIVSVIGLTQAILTFDVVSMMTYAFTIVMGIIFGILQMNQTEEYWTDEFWRYAKLRQNI